MYDRRYSQLPVIHQRENMVHGDKVSHNMGAHYIMCQYIIMVINGPHYVGNNVRFRKRLSRSQFMMITIQPTLFEASVFHLIWTQE